MSTRAVAWALDSRSTGPLDPATRLVLVTLADHAHADGTSAFPSKRTISERIDVSERTVQRHLRTLEELGLITPGDARLVDHIPHYARPNVWNLALTRPGDNLTPGDTGGPTGSHSGYGPGVTGDSQTKNITNPRTDPPNPPPLAAPETLGRARPLEIPAPPRGECSSCSETRLLVSDGLCRRCLIAAEADA